MYRNRNDRLRDWLLPFHGHRYTEKWVLRDINIEIRSGEAVGLVGMNGAGKSTLLKIITGTTAATTGKVELHGSVSALLELGLGFHPDFTGRQNVYMSGQLLGYTIEEIRAYMEKIEDFAEIGKAIDDPVRTYSSGMQVRLAFSVATMKRPDVLIVDEALSVGDAYFQQKSFNRIKRFKKDGTTLLLVSHDKTAIQSVCNRAILLKDGHVLRDGKPENVMNFYNAMLSERAEQNIREDPLAKGGYMVESGSGEATVADIRLVDTDKNTVLEAVPVGKNVCLLMNVLVKEDIEELVVGTSIKDAYGQDVYGINTYYEKKTLYKLQKGDKVHLAYHFPMNLGAGKYSITTALHTGSTHLTKNYEWKDLAYTFEVINTSDNYFVGTAWLPTQISISVNGKDMFEEKQS